MERNELNLNEQEAFKDPDVTLSHRGELINDSRTNYTKRVKVGDRHYYVKRYFRAGKYLRRLIGPSRARQEWKNAGWLSENDIPCPRRVAFGEGNRWMGDYWGIVVNEEMPNTLDLRKIRAERPDLLKDGAWVNALCYRLADVVRRMHARDFIHNDLQWRNILVDLGATPDVYIIDSPAGRRTWLPGYRRGMLKDLAAVDKLARTSLSKTQRLRFFLQYHGTHKLTEILKSEVRWVLRFNQQ